jgi:outer membrane protein OmpA-like peptidoglycan-associated protein
MKKILLLSLSVIALSFGQAQNESGDGPTFKTQAEALAPYDNSKLQDKSQPTMQDNGSTADGLGHAVIYRDIKFVGFTSKLDPSSYKSIDNIISKMRKDSKMHIEIAVHSDNALDYGESLSLTEARARMIRSYIVGKGIHTDRVISVGVGSKEPRADNGTPKGRAENRRVEVIFK